MGRTQTKQSDLRAAQLAATRTRIIEAAAQGFAPWSSSMPFDKVAARAGVSERTVYRHFPTQRDLVQAVTAHVVEHAGWDPNVSAEELGAMTAHAFAYFGTLLEGGAHEPEETTADLQELRGQRLRMMERAIGPYTAGLPPDQARGICAVFAGLCRVHFLRAMHEHWGLDGAEAGRAVEWAINTLLAELRREKKKWDKKTPSKARSRKRT